MKDFVSSLKEKITQHDCNPFEFERKSTLKSSLTNIGTHGTHT